ncbi:MAG: hypothetical protein ACXW3C_00010 [Pyrinomonadaceae bacterium]
MKKRVGSALALILIGSFFVFNLGAQTKGRGKNPLKDVKRARSEKGLKVGDRVKQLRATNNTVNAALEAFEKKGRQPKFDEAVSFTGSFEQPREVAPRKSHHASQQTTISGDGVEVIFITFLELYNEWQGTTIANFYDANGALEEQYVADVVITRSEYDHSEWTARFELKFESDGVGYLNHRPGMFTNFSLGTPILEQSAPLSLDTSQFASTEQMDSYYNVYPDQFFYDNPGGGDGGGGGGGGIQPIQNQQARLVKTRSVKHAHAVAPPPPGVPGLSPWTFYTIRGWGSAAREAGLVCGASAGGCALASAIFAEATWAPCTVAGCGGGVIYAAATRLRIVRR